MPEPLNGMLQFGALGLVLAWTLWRQEPRLDRLERAIDRLTRAQMLTLLTHDETPDPIKRQAQAVLRELPPLSSGGDEWS